MISQYIARYHKAQYHNNIQYAFDSLQGRGSLPL